MQLVLLAPFVWGYDFKVIVTNKRIRAGKLLAFHNVRVSQEGVFAELKIDCGTLSGWISCAAS